MALPRDGRTGQSRAIPVDFHHCPTVAKPKRKATDEEIGQYKEQKKKLKLSKQESERIKGIITKRCGVTLCTFLWKGEPPFDDLINIVGNFVHYFFLLKLVNTRYR